MTSENQEFLQKQQHSTALHDTLQQRDIRLIIFPDWSQSENLCQNLAPVISASAMHSDKHRLILFFDTSTTDAAAAKQALGSIVSSVLPPEVLDDPQGPVLLPIGKLNEAQWQLLLPHLTARISLEHENKEAIAATNADELPVWEIESLIDQAIVQVEGLARGLYKPEVKSPMQERLWNTTLPRETMLSIQIAHSNYSYRGVPLIKNPFDLALYPLLIWNLKPLTIIEIGSKDGGSAIWLGDMLSNFGIDGRIYSIDVVKVTSVSHPRVTFMEGDGRVLQETLTSNFLQSLQHPLLVIEDADHAYKTTKHVLDFFHPYLKQGEYMVIEDGIISDLIQDASYNSGPHKALKEFLLVHKGRYEIDDSYCNFFGYNFTWCTNGFLKKLSVEN